MSTITIILTDLPKGRGVSVRTSGSAPVLGQQRTPAEALAMDLHRICHQQANTLQYEQLGACLACPLAANPS